MLLQLLADLAAVLAAVNTAAEPTVDAGSQTADKTDAVAAAPVADTGAHVVEFICHAAGIEGFEDAVVEEEMRSFALPEGF